MTTQLSTSLSPDRLALPPPIALDLIDGDRVLGWIAGDAVGFGGFGTEADAAHAAWVAYRTMARRLARLNGTRPIPIDTEPLTLQRRGDAEVILASGRPVATLVRPGPASPSGPDSFGFEVRVPPPADELQMRVLAHLMYRALRRSGLRWAMWQPAAPRAAGVTAEQAGADRANDQANDHANDITVGVTSDGKGGQSDVTERVRQRAWRRPALPWWRAGRPDRGKGSRAARLRGR